MSAPAASEEPRSGRSCAPGGRALLLGLVVGLGLIGCDLLSLSGRGEGEAAPLTSHAPAAGYSDAWGVGAIQHWEGGAGWVRTVSDGYSNPSLVRSPRFPSPTDLRGRFLHFWLRVDRLDRLQGLELRVFSRGSEDDYFAFTVPLYDDPEFGILHPGHWVPFTFGFGQARKVGRPDRSAVDGLALYVEDRGAGPVTVDWSGVKSLAEPEQGLVSFTFDDGYAAHARVAAPALAAYGFAATAYVMPRELGTPGYMSVTELKALQHRFGWDVAAHHAMAFTNMSNKDLEGEIAHIQGFLGEHGLGGGHRHLAYPLGKHDLVRVLGIVRESFATARIAGGGVETLPPADLHRLRTFNVMPSMSPSEIGTVVRRARDHREWLILMFHHLVEEPDSPLQYGVKDFEEVVAEVARSGIEVRTVGEVWRTHRVDWPLQVEPGQRRDDSWLARLRGATIGADRP